MIFACTKLAFLNEKKFFFQKNGFWINPHRYLSALFQGQNREIGWKWTRGIIYKSENAKMKIDCPFIKIPYYFEL